ncbi:hypothetical protein RND81_13G010000 [Saponaria officinalis]|uniref:Uncharacterized protein n=1 Tax=Saponaria officinalis TaxID=3572 RepID=A0AAW1GUV2_SAPOF
MESSTSGTPIDAETKRKPRREVVQRCTFAVIFSLFSIFSLTYAFGFFAVLLATFSIPPANFASQCRIVSSSIDLKTSKICELGLLNYKAKRVFYPSERRKFRCRYDYYWASIFKVEFRDHFSGQTLLGLAEAPKEALPSDCRPNFATAWLTKNTLKVNETYDCWYTSTHSKIELFKDSYFGCQAKDPSLSEMIRRYSILCMKIVQSSISDQLKAKNAGFGMVIGVIVGIFTAVITIVSFAICQTLLSSIPRAVKRVLASIVRRVFMSRMFFLVAYFSVVGWVTIQYGKRLGLGELFVEY